MPDGAGTMKGDVFRMTDPSPACLRTLTSTGTRAWGAESQYLLLVRTRYLSAAKPLRP